MRGQVVAFPGGERSALRASILPSKWAMAKSGAEIVAGGRVWAASPATCDELAVFIERGDAMHPKIVEGGCILDWRRRHGRERAAKFFAHAQTDGLLKIAHEFRLIWKRYVVIRERWEGADSVARGCDRDECDDQERSQRIVEKRERPISRVQPYIVRQQLRAESLQGIDVVQLE
jgi:hypothetical protein